MDGWHIVGIQQVGIGVADLEHDWGWYRRRLGFDVPIVREAAEAPLMAAYTGDRTHRRDALLAINLQGGGGLEMWMFTDRRPAAPTFEPHLGDGGILAPKLGAPNVGHAFQRLAAAAISPRVMHDPAGEAHFFLRSPGGLPLQVVASGYPYIDSGAAVAGVCGAIIGVPDIEQALPLYRDLLGYDRLLYDESGVAGDLVGLPGADRRLRRVALARAQSPLGAFARLLGPSRIELIECRPSDPPDPTERAPRPIYAGRYWGDLGFIHICFDVVGMDSLQVECARRGFPFTVDSGRSFSMGAAAGRFAYIEDGAGTLIEFVETYRLPILPRLGLALDLRRRNVRRPLPKLLLRLLALRRVRDAHAD